MNCSVAWAADFLRYRRDAVGAKIPYSVLVVNMVK